MNAHALIGRMGSTDEAKVSIPEGYVEHTVNLVQYQTQLAFGISNTLLVFRQMGLTPTEVGLDLLVLATLVVTADMRISRRDEAQDAWTREIAIDVPVSDPALWSDQAELLQTMLRFLTGDYWTVAFHKRPKAFRTFITRSKVETDASRRHRDVSLFSGGLDSLIGALDLIEAGRDPLFISHWSEGATSKSQYNCEAAISAALPRYEFSRIRGMVKVPKAAFAGAGAENTTRGRSFLFFALAACAATALEKSRDLIVPENGLISLNVPLDVLRLGSLSTRTTHPFYVARWQDLVKALGIGIRLVNPYQLKTKGEMVAECQQPKVLRRIIASSLSCAHPSTARYLGYQGRGIEHCGYCFPCLIRRAAIVAAWGKDPTPYTLEDLESEPLDPRTSKGAQIRSVQVACARLTANPELARSLVLKPGPLSDVHKMIPDLADLYRRGMFELHGFLDGVVTEPSS